MKYIPAIGLEIHTELNTQSKMFCDCLNESEAAAPNSNVCVICTGQPGAMPTANIEAIKLVIKTGLALGSSILPKSKFDRKNYFYPDLPKGYQISQYDLPLCLGGGLEVGCGATKKNIRVRRVHLEEDTARLVHPDGADYSLVDFNRSGVPLMELVTEPDIATAAEARLFAEELQLILRCLGVSDADMEKGKMRVEVNISLASEADTAHGLLGTKVEIKNLNSLRAVEGSVAFELERQAKLLDEGQKIVQETRGWNADRMQTVSQREKEEAFDYRYFPEPDLTEFEIGGEFVASIRASVGELPAKKRERFASEYGLEPVMAEIFIKNRELANYFENTMSELANWVKEEEMKASLGSDEFNKLARVCANYLSGDLVGLLGGKPFVRDEIKITPENFAEFATMIHTGQISSKMAKIVLAEMHATGADPSHIIEDKGLVQINDPKELEAVAEAIVAENAQAAADYRAGKENAFQFLVGKLLAKTQGKANPQVARLAIKKSLDKQAA